MRFLGLMACAVLGFGCSGSENPGLALHIVLPQPALGKANELLVTLENPSGSLPMQTADASFAGVLVHTEGGKIQLRFLPSAFTLRSEFDVLLTPSGKMPLTVMVSGTITQSNGQVLGSAAPIQASVDAGRRTRVTLTFACVNAATCAPASEYDLATRPATVRLTGVDGDQLTAIALGHFSSDDRTRADLVAAARGKAVYVFYGQNRSFPSPSELDPTTADVKILARPPETLGDAAAVGDIDGDDIDDLVVTATNGNDAQTAVGAGVAYIVLGTRLRNRGTIDLASETTIPRIFGSAAQEQLGTSVTLARIDSDRNFDIVLGAAGQGAVGAMGAIEAGRVYIVFGASTPSTVYTHLGQQNRTILGAVASAPIGRSLAAADLDGDNLAEIVIGNFSESNRGAVYVVRGSRLGAPGMLNLGTSYDVKLLGTTRSLFGWSVALADVDAQNGREIIVGARSAGAVYIFAPMLGTSPLDRDAGLGQFELVLKGSDGSTFGHALASGKLDGDDAADLLIGAPLQGGPDGTRMSAGACYLVRGAQLGALSAGAARQVAVATLPAALTLYGARARDELGTSVFIGNYDVSDPLDEIIISAPKAGTNFQGAIYAIQDLP